MPHSGTAAASVGQERRAANQIVGHLIARRQFQRGRGALAWLWIGISLPLAFATLVSLAQQEFHVACFLAFLVLTGLKLNRLATDVENAHGAIQTRDLGKEALPGLIDALEWPDHRVRGIARLHLAGLLPQLKPEDATLLSDDQRGYLWHLLTWRTALTEPLLVLGILHAAATFGDAYALPNVVRLASLPPLSQAFRHVATAARGCLAPLEEQVARQRSGTREASNAALRSVPVRSATDPAQAATPDAAATQSANATLLGTAQTPLATGAETASSQIDADLRSLLALRHEQPGMRQGYLVAAWLVIVPFGLCRGAFEIACGNWLLGLLLGLLALASTQLYRVTLTTRRAALALRIARLDKVEHVGRLVEMLEWPDTEIQSAAAAALCGLLPRLRASDTRFLSADHRAILYRALRPSNAGGGTELMLATLKALEQIGDADAAPYVQKLAECKLVNYRLRPVKAAAQACLPYLLQRPSTAQLSQTLLRPSAYAESSADLLVRAITEPSVEDANQLLRPQA